MNATVCYYTSDALISRLIRWWTHSAVSHVAIGCDISSIPVVLHATAGGVQMVSRQRYEKTERLVYEFQLGEFGSEIQLALRWLGEPYDYRGFFHRAAKIALHWFGICLRRKRSTPREQVCSEFVRRLHHWSWTDAPPPEEINAQQLLRTSFAARLPQVAGVVAWNRQK